VHDIGFIECIAQNVLFELVDFGMDGFADGLIALGHEVEQGVQHEIFTMLEQQRARLAALAYGLVRG